MSSFAAASACFCACCAACSEINCVRAASVAVWGGRTPVGMALAAAGRVGAAAEPSVAMPAMRMLSSLTAAAAMREMV